MNNFDEVEPVLVPAFGVAVGYVAGAEPDKIDSATVEVCKIRASPTTSFAAK